MRLLPLFLTTGLATVLAGSLLLQQAAHAEGMDSRDVTALLARAQTLNTRCKILKPDETQNLRDLVARAEIALASKYSVATAKQQLAKGRADGLAAACDQSANVEVHDILKMGLQATNDAPGIADEQTMTAARPKAPELQQPAAITKPVPPAAVPVAVKAAAKPVENKVARQPAPQPPSKKPVLVVSKKHIVKSTVTTGAPMASYATLAEDYYVELRCRSMPLSSAKRMYKNILAQHHAALISGGPAAVRRLLGAAQARASARSCT